VRKIESLEINELQMDPVFENISPPESIDGFLLVSTNLLITWGQSYIIDSAAKPPSRNREDPSKIVPGSVGIGNNRKIVS